MRVTLKKPSKKRARHESEKWGGVDKPENAPKFNEEEGIQDEASYSFVSRMLSHDLPDKAVNILGEHLILQDSQVRRLGRGNTIFQYEVEIFELVHAGCTGLLNRPGFATK